jgi:hypothetical protein
MGDKDNDKAKEEHTKPDPKTGDGAILPARDQHIKSMKKKT